MKKYLLFPIFLILIACSRKEKFLADIKEVDYIVKHSELLKRHKKAFRFALITNMNSSGKYAGSKLADVVESMNTNPEKIFGVVYQSYKGGIQSSFLRQALTRKLFDLIVLYGLESNEVLSLTERYPEQKFFLPDSYFLPTEYDYKNIVGSLISTHEASFLAGIVAGKMTSTNNIGIIASDNKLNIDTYTHAFRQGVKEVNPKAGIFIRSISERELNPNDEKVKAIKLYTDDDVDIIFQVADNAPGILQAALEENKYVITTGLDDDLVHVVMLNVLKKLSIDFRETIEAIYAGKFKPGFKYYRGLSDQTIDISWNQNFIDQAPELRPKLAETSELLKVYRKHIKENKLNIYNAYFDGQAPEYF